VSGRRPGDGATWDETVVVWNATVARILPPRAPDRRASAATDAERPPEPAGDLRPGRQRIAHDPSGGTRPVPRPGPLAPDRAEPETGRTHGPRALEPQAETTPHELL